MTMQKIDLQDLEAYSPWPARLRGEMPYAPKTKSHAELYREYNDEKYAGLLDATTISGALERYWGPGDEVVACSRHDELFAAPRAQAHALRNKLFVESLRPYLAQTTTVVELGAGFGQAAHVLMSAFPQLMYYAGEFAPNGRKLGEQLLPQVRFVPFDLYAPEWEIFEGVQDALVLTVHTVEMLPDARLFVNQLSRYRSHILHAVHFEPLYEDGDELAALRRGYIDLNGYCKNIGESVPNAKIEHDFFGLNPLFPEARIEWKP